MEKYRTDQYSSVYEYDKRSRAYVLIGKLNGQSFEEFISEYEEYEEYEEDWYQY